MSSGPDRELRPRDAALEESAEELYENAPCGYLSTRPDGTIVKVNRTFLDWTGYGREELLDGRRFVDLLTAGGRIYHETHYAPLLALQDSANEIAVDVRRADGTRLPVLVSSVLKRDADQRPDAASRRPPRWASCAARRAPSPAPSSADRRSCSSDWIALPRGCRSR